MQYRRLGRDGDEIPVIMFGAWPIGGGLGRVDEAAAKATVDRALDLGITAIDTAEFYRDSESILGRALQGRPRDRLFLATKVSAEPFTRARIREALDNSLRALKTDYVDLYQLHRYPSDVPLEEAMGGLVDAQQSGKARFIGVSNFTTQQTAAAHAIAPIHSIQPRLNIFDNQDTRELLPYCAREGIGAIVHSPLAKGLLTGRYTADHVFPADDERSQMSPFQGQRFAEYLAAAEDLGMVAEEKGISLVQLAIAWTLAQPGVTSCIAGPKTPAQVEEYLGAVGVELGAEDLSAIASIAARVPGPTY
jgi:aryl-alcohol dehydrogenase-like predicted oxidoreductase